MDCMEQLFSVSLHAPTCGPSTGVWHRGHSKCHYCASLAIFAEWNKCICWDACLLGPNGATWPATGVVAQPRSAICDRITWHNVVRELHFLLGGAPRPDFHCSLMSLRVSDRSRERKALILWENPSPSKMGVMVVVIVLHEGGIRDHH